ncbi:MAG: hypothetical protein GTO63_33570, partial [Anaerolineae bacterium]|nr:hypothetical protein [Anaerolineae bacterium]NIN99567.1 hypothetical protein [Anaerolineae bacterium]NIQ82424.1 hypothetical protein [Anaerolineae bacterium]
MLATLTREERAVAEAIIRDDPPTWMETHLYVEDPRDPYTGEQFAPGPIRLAEHQKRILREALAKDDGLFRYSTVVYSAIKKSGKTRLAAGV